MEVHSAGAIAPLRHSRPGAVDMLSATAAEGPMGNPSSIRGSAELLVPNTSTSAVTTIAERALR
jgi:hypothetical protein